MDSKSDITNYFYDQSTFLQLSQRLSESEDDASGPKRADTQWAHDNGAASAAADGSHCPPPLGAIAMLHQHQVLQGFADGVAGLAPSCVLALTASCPAELAANAPWSLSDFVVSAHISQAPHGSVYACVWQNSGISAAVKVHPKAALSHTAYGRLREAIAVHAAVEHPHINPLWAAFEDAHHVVTVARLEHQGNLYDALQTGRCPRSEAELVLRYVQPCLLALACLHEHGILHRGVQLEHALMAHDGTLALAGFANAVRVNTGPADCVGTLECMSPEVLVCSLRGLHPEQLAACGHAAHSLPADALAAASYTDKADVWGLGVLAYECLAHASPFMRATPHGTVSAIFCVEPEMSGFCSARARSFLQRALAKNAAARATAQELLAHPWILSASEMK